MKQNADIPSELLNFKKMEINLVEMLNKVAKSANSSQDVLDINWIDAKGDRATYKYPAVGSVRKDVNSLRTTMESLITNDNNRIELEYKDGTVRQFKAKRYFDTLDTFDELSGTALNISNYFRTKNNWFFESFISPLLYVNIDVSTRIGGMGTTKFSVKRVILNNLTSTQIDYWNNSIIGRNTWGLGELFDNLESRTIDYFVDDNIVNMPPVVNRFNGRFSVLQIVQETINIDGVDNKRNYYKLDTLEYRDILNNKNTVRILAEEDILITKNDTEYRVVSVDTKTRRVLLEKLFGSDSIAVGTNVLKVRPERYKVPYLQVNVGFNEREVIFIRPIDIDNNITTDEWSLGFPLFTNDLIIKMDDGTEMTLAEFYKIYVIDFGMLIMNLAKEKTVPTAIGLKPNAPVLDSNNFKIIRVNDHIKKSPKIEKIKQKYAIKDRISSEIQSIDKSISKYKTSLQRPDINTSEKRRIETKVSEAVDKKMVKTKQYETTVKEIDIGIKDSPEITVPSKYKIRGYWEIPDPMPSEYGNQEVVGFIVNYRYLNPSGLGKNPDEIKYAIRKRPDRPVSGAPPKQIPVQGPIRAPIASPRLSATQAAIQAPIATTQAPTDTGIAYFSEWNENTTKVRPKEYNDLSGSYEWQQEDVKNPDIVNSNQIEISITKGEQVEIKVRSVSEAGWPSNPLLSDWSNIVAVSFPTNLEDTESTENLITDIRLDSAVIRTKEYYDSVGLDKHLKSSVTVGDKTFSHDAADITTTITDVNKNKVLSVNEALLEVQGKLIVLENTVSTDTGKLKVSFINDENTINVSNGDTVSLFAGYYKDIIENTAASNGSVISKGYTIVLENTSQTPLELVARMSGGIEQPVIFDPIADEDYKNNRAYYKTPLIVSGVIENDVTFGDYKYPSPYQSSNVQSQILFTRLKNYGLSKNLYSHYSSNPATPYDFKGYTIDGSITPYAGYGHYLPYDPTFNTGALVISQDVWNGAYLSNSPSGGGHLSEFCIHKDHPTVVEAVSQGTSFQKLVRPPLSDKQLYHGFSHGENFETSESELTNVLGADYFAQAEKIQPVAYVSGASDDSNYPVKMGFITNDEFLIGKYTCGSYLFTAPYNYLDISVEGNHPTLAKKVIEIGIQNAINIPVMFQFRNTDKLGYVGGFRTNETLSNVKYTKKIGIDIYLRGNNPISYGDVFSFDIEASCQYKSGLNVIDPAYTPAKGDVKNLSLMP